MSHLPKALMLDSGSTVEDFAKGRRVQAHPATDTWMRGDRYGVVEVVGRQYIHVRMDRSRRLIPFHPDNLLGA